MAAVRKVRAKDLATEYVEMLRAYDWAGGADNEVARERFVRAHKLHIYELAEQHKISRDAVDRAIEKN